MKWFALYLMARPDPTLTFQHYNKYSIAVNNTTTLVNNTVSVSTLASLLIIHLHTQMCYIPAIPRNN